MLVTLPSVFVYAPNTHIHRPATCSSLVHWPLAAPLEARAQELLLPLLDLPRLVALLLRRDVLEPLKFPLLLLLLLLLLALRPLLCRPLLGLGLPLQALAQKLRVVQHTLPRRLLQRGRPVPFESLLLPLLRALEAFQALLLRLDLGQ